MFSRGRVWDGYQSRAEKACLGGDLPRLLRGDGSHPRSRFLVLRFLSSVHRTEISQPRATPWEFRSCARRTPKEISSPRSPTVPRPMAWAMAIGPRWGPDQTHDPLEIAQHQKQQGVRASSQEHRRRRIERPPGCRVTPGRSAPPRSRFGLVFQTRPRLVSATPKSASEGVRASARRNTGADVLRDLQVVRVTPGRSGPPRSRFGLVFQTRPRLVSATPKSASEGVRARARRKTGADVLRDLQVVRVTPGRSGPPRSRFLVLRNLSISIFRQPGHALEPLASGRLYTSPKRKRGGPRNSSQEDRRRRIERPPGCPRHARPIRTPSLALRAGIPDPTTTGERNTKTRKRGGPRDCSQEHRRRRIERPSGCPRHDPADPDPLARAFGVAQSLNFNFSAAWPRSGTSRFREALYQPEAQARGSARELAGTQAPTY